MVHRTLTWLQMLQCPNAELQLESRSIMDKFKLAKTTNKASQRRKSDQQERADIIEDGIWTLEHVKPESVLHAHVVDIGERCEIAPNGWTTWYAVSSGKSMLCHGLSRYLMSENQSSRDTGGPGIEAGFPLVFHLANISTPIPA